MNSAQKPNHHVAGRKPILRRRIDRFFDYVTARFDWSVT